MKPVNFRLYGCLLALFVVGATAHAQRSDILPGKRRADTVMSAKLIVDPLPQAELTEDLNNPFFPNSRKPKPVDPFASATEEIALPEHIPPASVYELLDTMAPQINPTGSIILGGQPLLLFGRKRIRVGETLPIIYDGERYTLLISRIGSSNFTLRLGAAEVTRPIKSTPTP